MHNTLFTSQKSLPFSPAEVSSITDQVRSGKEFDGQIGIFLRLPSSTAMTAVIPPPSPPPSFFLSHFHDCCHPTPIPSSFSHRLHPFPSGHPTPSPPSSSIPCTFPLWFLVSWPPD
ncbi:hypothetical protein ACFXTH_028946 [Malus domestica]